MSLEKYRLFPNVVKHINFIALWAVFALVYIANVHHAEKKLRAVDKIQREIDDVRRAYIHEKDKSLYSGTMYEIVKGVDGLEVDEDMKIPKKIKRS